MLAALALVLPGAGRANAGPCTAPVVNAVLCENTLPGTPRSTWDVPSPSTSIEGFTDDVSYNLGDTVHFKIDTTATAYTIAIYRLGWYGGDGARLIASIAPTAVTNQPVCNEDDTVTGLIDCSNWSESATWTVPTSVVSGYYIAKLTITGGGSGANQIPFIVRNDASHSAVFMQASNTTWEAYNEYQGNSLYVGQPAGRAYMVSFNRPYETRSEHPEDFLFNAEYPMVRFLERNGYDVTYTTDTDSDRRGSLIKNHQVFLSVGHDEYWSGQQRANVEAARDSGVNLAFFSGNEVFWKTRWQNGGMDGSGAPYRTLVTYKETQANAAIDPQDPPTTTATWRDPRFGAPADGDRPENGLTGTIFTVNCCTTNMTVDGNDGQMRFWRNTRVAGLTPSQSTTLGSGTLGYEWDSDLDNGARPAGEIDLSTSYYTNMDVLQDYGSTYANGSATHHLTEYRAPSGALVFGAGSVQYSWGLDDQRDSGTGTVDTAMQQATVNLFADMGVQPGSLMSGLVAATASTDHTPPTSVITSPTNGSSVPLNTPLTVTGTATDAGGGKVGGVEVSVDGGTTWHPATGRGAWTYTFTPTFAGQLTIKSRATDDSLNTETPSAGATVTAGGPPPPVTCAPCTIWPSTTVPASPSDSDTSAVELGVKFVPDRSGTIKGIRFYKGAGNTGTHVGHLWTSTGTQLGAVTFTNETASGWQEADFATPIPVTANTVYIASYFAPSGHYAEDDNYFSGATVNTPLTALANGEQGPNGVYNSGTGFPTSTWNAANYYVDVAFNPASSTTGPPAPTVTAQTPAANATGVSTTAPLSATFSEDVESGTPAWNVTAAGSTTPVAGTLSYNQTNHVSTFTPSAALTAGTQYTATVSGAKDTTGASTMNPVSWSFTTAGSAPPPSCAPCTIWPSTAVPGTTDDPEVAQIEVGVKFQTTVAGHISGIRFYKGSTNTGTHVAHLWTSGGTLLATATFTNETASGWQQVNFATPVAVAANTTYVASYYVPVGHYSSDENSLTNGAGTGPVTALPDGTSGGNGVYLYAGGGGFPNSSWNASNYWVDVVFTTP